MLVTDVSPLSVVSAHSQMKLQTRCAITWLLSQQNKPKQFEPQYEQFKQKGDS